MTKIPISTLVYQLLAFTSTFLNLSCGLAGIIVTLDGDISLAFQLLLAGAIFDFFDGKFARRAPVKSDLGVYADSFADLFTFALLPAYVILESGVFVGSGPIVFDITIGLVIASFYAIAGWYRLVRFSVKPTGQKFEGLPSSGAAMLLCSFAVIYLDLSRPSELDLVFIILALGSAILMITKVPYPSPKRMLRPDNYLMLGGTLLGVFYIIVPNVLSAILIWVIFLGYIALGPYYLRKTERLPQGIETSH